MSEEEKKAKKTTAKKSDTKKAETKSATAKKSDAKASEKKSAEKKPAAKKSAEKKADAPKAETKAAAKKPAGKREKKADTGVKKQGKLIEHIRLYDVIERPVVTEKSTMAAEHNKVVFKVRPEATKKDVKDAVEALFGVKVVKVNTINTKGKVKRFRGRTGQRNDQRKAIVTLKDGDSIDLASGLK